MNKLKDLYQLQKQAKQIREKLQNTHIEAEIEGVKVVVDGQQEIVKVQISDSACEEAHKDNFKNKKKLEENLVKALNKAVKRSQQIGAEEMKGVMGDMGLGGLPGM